MRDEIARAVTVIQLLGEDAVPTGAHGIGGAWQAAHQGAIGQPRQGARLHGGGADIGHGYLAEQLAETIDLLVEQAAHCFRRAVAAGKAGAAGDQHHLHHVFGDPVGHLGADLVEVVLEQHALGQVVAGGGEAVDEDLAGGVSLQGAGVADGQYSNIEGYEGRIGLGFHGTVRLSKEQPDVISQAPVYLPQRNHHEL